MGTYVYLYFYDKSKSFKAMWMKDGEVNAQKKKEKKNITLHYIIQELI